MSKEENSGEAKPQNASTPDVQADVPPKDTNADIYENRGPKKIIRIVTVMAYLFSVSFVGILLSSYYLFLWEPPNPRLIDRGRLRADPQMQLLIDIPSEKTDFKKKGNDFFPEIEVNHTYKPLLGRMMYGAYDGDDTNVNSQDKKPLNAMLLKLRRSLVMKTHVQNQNLSKHETATFGSANSSIRIENILNSTKIMKNLISNKLHKNISDEKTQSNNTNLPPEIIDPVNMLDIENTLTSKVMTVQENKTKQKHFNERSVTDINSIVDREKENRNYKRKHNVAKLYPVYKSNIAKTNDDIINGNNHRILEHNNSFKTEQKFSKIDILGNMKELIKQEELINDNRKNDSNNTIITSKEYVKDLTKPLLSINVSVNSLNFQQNYSSNNDYLSNNHIEELARNKSIISSSYDSGYIRNNSEFHQPSDDPTVVTRNSEGEKIRMDLRAFLMEPG